MKKLLVAMALFSLLCIPAVAQDVPIFEVFGGYSLLHLNENDELDSSSMTHHGFIVAVEGNANANVGIVFESGFYQATERWEEFDLTGDCRWRHVPILFGPRFGYRTEKFRVFGHYLLGKVFTSYIDKDDEGTVWEEYCNSNFGHLIGGGIDITLSNSISIRPAQFDFIGVKVSEAEGDWRVNTWQKGFRYSAGVVIKLGSR